MKQRLRTFLSGVIFAVTLFQAVPSAVYAEDAAWPEAPEVTSEGAILIEASTGTILYEKNAFETFYPASTTKLMTALLAIEQSPLSEIVTCSYDSVHKIGWDSSRIGLVEGEQLNMEDALYAILLASANEVSYAVAEHVGGSYDSFISMMNKRAKELGCVNTSFANPHGLDDPEHYTCPYDLALIAKKAIEYTTFRRISGSYYYEVPPTNLNVARPIGNTHQILRRKITCEGVFAGKTGHTSTAGNCLVTCAERDGLTLIAVVMKSPDSSTVYGETIALLEYGFANFSLAPFSTSDADTKNAFPILFEDEEALISEIVSPLTVSGASLVLPTGASYYDLTKKITLKPNERLSAGENVIGEVSYYYADNYVGSAEIIFYSETDVLVAPSPTPSPTPQLTNPAASPFPSAAPTVPSSGSAGQENDFRPIIIGVIVGIIVLVVGFYLILIELPYRRRKKEYYRNRRQH